MSELPELPPRVPRHRPLPPGGLEQAVAVGRRRRVRFLGGTTAGTALAVTLVAALLASPDTSRDSLQVATPEPVPVASDEPGPDSSPEPAPAPSPGAEGRPSAEPTPGAEEAPQERSSPAGEAPQGAGPQEQAPQPPPPDQRPAYRELTDEDAAGHEFCTPTKVATGGCAYGKDNGPVVRRGTAVTVASGACSGPDSAGVNVFEFRSGQETELVVLQGGREVFRFSSTVRYVEGPHERRLRGGRCLEFRQVWRGVDTAGDPVPAGEYRVVLTVLPSGARYDFDDGTSERQEPYANSHELDVTIVD